MLGRKKPRKRRAYREEYEEEEGFHLNPETKGAIFTILIFVVAFLSALSMFNSAGALGRVLNTGLSYLFGWGDWLFILVLIFLGFILIKSQQYKVKIVSYIGLLLIIVSVAGILHFFVDEFTFKEITKAGTGGGALGFGVGVGLDKLLGFWGTIVVLIATLLIGIFLAFNTSFKDITEKAKALGILKEKFLPEEGEEEEDEEEDDEDEKSVEKKPR